MKNSLSFLSFFNLFFLFLCLVWQPVQIYYLHVDANGRALMLLSIVVLLINLGAFREHGNLFRSPAFLCWTALTLFSFINSIAKGIITDRTVMAFLNFNFLMPYAVISIAVLELGKNKTRAVRVVFYALLVYLLIGASHISSIQFERTLSVELGNLIPLTGVGFVFLASVLKSEQKLRGNWITYFVIIISIAVLIIISGTRKALGGFVIVVAGMMLQSVKKLNLKSILMIGFAVAVLYFIMNWVMDNTLMGERLAESSEKYDVPLSSNPKVNIFLMSLLGDRALQYYAAIELFHQHSITGIGLNHFMSEASFEVRLHTEYMVQLCENGIIGFSLLVLFYILLMRGFRRKRKMGEKTTIYLFGLIAILFINLTAWTYDQPYIMAMYATFICEIYSSEQVSICSIEEETKV